MRAFCSPPCIGHIDSILTIGTSRTGSAAVASIARKLSLDPEPPIRVPGDSASLNRLDPWAQRLLRVFQIAAGCLAMAVAALVLIGGWGAGIDAIKRILPAFASMKVNTTIGIGALGAATALSGATVRYRALRSLLAAVALLIGILTLAEYALHWHAGIEELLAKHLAGASTDAAARPASAAALMIALLGAALLCVDRPALSRIKTVSAATSSLIAWATLNGYIFGPRALHEVPQFGFVALHTAAVLWLLGLAVLAAEPLPSPTRQALASSTGGVICRWLLPPAILAPPLLGTLLARGSALISLPAPFGWAVYSTLSTVGSIWLIMTLAQRITTIDAQRSAATELSQRLRQAVSDREIFKAVVENSSDFIGIADAEGLPTYLNPAGRRMIGLDADFPIGTLRIADCYPARLHAFVEDVILAQMQEHGRWQGETLFRHFATHEDIPVSDTHFLIRESGTDRLLGWATITRDVSEITAARRSVEAANRGLEEANRKLRRAHQEQQMLADAGATLAATLDYEETLECVARTAAREFSDHCFIALVETDGDARRRIAASRDVSLEWACEILAQSPFDTASAHPFAEPLRTRRPVLVERFSPETIASLAQDDSERLRALGALAPRSAISAPLIVRGKLLGVVVFLSSAAARSFDAQDLRVAEALAVRAALCIENARLYQTTQRAIRARDEVLGMVAHDLRNPLNSIMIQTALLKGQSAKIGDALPERVAAIYRSAVRMNRLIQDLLDVTRAEAGRLTLDRDRVSPDQILRDAMEAHDALAAEKFIELRIEPAAGLADLWADRDRLRQVFENLIFNAVKFTPARGRITLAALPGDREIVFSVADTGVGINAEELTHIFDRFWQARNSGRRGTGLGLAIVKSIVEAHGGRVWAVSSPGDGATFHFTIPTVLTQSEPVGKHDAERM